MTIRIKKYEWILIGIVGLSIIIPMIFAGKEIRFDIYLLYDYAEHSKKGYEGRKLSVILYELGSYLRCIIPFFILWRRLRHLLFFVIFIICSLEFVFYMLFYGQGTDPYLILLSSLLILFLVIRKLWKRRKNLNGLYGPV